MFKLFGITIANLSLPDVLSRLDRFITEGGKHLVITANPEIMVEARRNPMYRQILRQASLVLADGIGLILASYFCGKPLTKGRVTGVSLCEALIKESGHKGYSVFLAGSTQDVINKTTQYFVNKYSNINIVGTYSGWNKKHCSSVVSQAETRALLALLQEKKPDVFLLAFGHPKQEIWLSEHLPSAPVKIAIGVGGAFDYFSGVVTRPPNWVSMLGFEWLFRLLSQPWRWRRVFRAVIIFPLMVLIDRIENLFYVEQTDKIDQGH